MSETSRTASCCCGQLSLTAVGEPSTVSMCHCFECQKRTGSLFGVQARFPDEKTEVKGEARAYTRTGDTGKPVTFYSCPVCSTTLYWQAPVLPGLTAVAVGAFGEPKFPTPHYSVYETRQHRWLKIEAEMEHYD